MTAIATTRLLSEQGISVYAPIIGYLPDYWVKGQTWTRSRSRS